MPELYFDHNATTRLRPEVRARFVELLDELHGNASSLHASGRRARHVLDDAREQTAAALGVEDDEIVFTSGGTEANNLALFGALAGRDPDCGLAVSAIEHSSVLGPARELERRGHRLAILPVTADGSVDLEAVDQRHLGPSTVLISVMAANNEIGTCAPLEELAPRLATFRPRPIWHTDAVQALGRRRLELRSSGVDLATFSAHKLGGPLGVGVLYRRRSVSLAPWMFGGEHEHGLRPGTENVPAIGAAALAIELAVRELETSAARLRQLTRGLWHELERTLDGIELLGLPIDHERRLPGTLNLLAPQLDGKVLVMRLDLEGLQCSAGSACASGSLEPSHVLLALGRTESEARAGLRLSLGRETSWSDVGQAVDILRRTLGAANARRAGGTGL